MLSARLWPVLVVLAAYALLPARAGAVDRVAHLRDASKLRSDRDVDVSRQRDASWRAATPPRASAATRASLAKLGRSWVSWDAVTDVPHRIVLADHPAAGVVASSALAEAHARELLVRHVDALAPGSTVDDFVLVTNDLSAEIRTVAFAQHHRGMPVQGGQLSFTYKHDRLLVIGSDALPFVTLPSRTTRVVDDHARDRADAWITRDIAGTTAAIGAVDQPTVLPVFEPGGVRYREVVRVPVEVESPPSRWSVWLDAATGEPVARRQELLFETGGVVYRVPVRRPNSDYADFGAPFVDVVVDAVQITTDEVGTFSFDTGSGFATNTPVGPFVRMSNAAGELASQQFQIIPGNGSVWTAPEDEQLDAQLTAFVHASRAKSYVRGIDAGLGWLDQQLSVTVNIDDDCNAFSDGDSLNFFHATDSCQNTGRIADVVYHELGHSVHAQSLIPGVGAFDTALSEGVADYLSMTIIGESGMGRGFFYDDTPLRELDPPGFEYRWPDDRGEVHDEGRIIAGALWDLRKVLVAKYGQPGVAVSDHIYYESTRRSVDIPSMYLSALVVDDDNGTLADGTPNACEINAAYGPHGLFSAGDAAEQVSVTDDAGGIRIELQLALPNFPACPVAASPTYLWRLRGEENAVETTMSNENGVWVGDIPPQLAGSVVQYQVHVNYDNGTPRSLPDNFVDPWYELFVGDTVPLYCTGFADQGVDWSMSGGFEVGLPLGTSGNRDPLSSYDSDGWVAGTGVDSFGLYDSNAFAVATGPVVNTAGFSNVRLQYRRWLTVEDGFFDQAGITADGETLWSNFRSNDMDFATFHHIDREWRFQDVDISAQAADGSVSIGFSLASDGGLQLGGWNVDEVCVVGFDPKAAICGNGVLEGTEQCDDGNVADGDGCDASCVLEGTTDGGDESDSITDDGGSSDEGDSDTDGPSLDGDELIGRGCGCNGGGGSGGALGLMLFGLVLGYRRQGGATRRRLPSCDSGTSGASSSPLSHS